MSIKEDWGLLGLRHKGKDFLQGHLTCDLNDLNTQDVLPGAACNLKGRVVASVYVMFHKEKDTHYLLLPKETIPILLDFWKLYLPLYRQTECFECAGDLAIVPRSATGVKNRAEAGTEEGAGAGEAAGNESTVSLPFLNSTMLLLHSPAAHQKIKDTTPPPKTGNAQLLKTSATTPLPKTGETQLLKASATAPLPKTGEAQLLNTGWEEFLMSKKTPYVSAEGSGKWTPQMLGYDELGAVNYEKGCYLGQEVVARTHYLGKTSRGCYLLEFTEPKPQPGMHFYNAKGDKTGELVNFCRASNQTGTDSWHCLAVLNHNFVDQKYLFADNEQKQSIQFL